MAKKREHFGGRLAVILAMAGSAIGLGNIWRFPYMVGEHGGAVFIIIYILSTLLISLPVFIAGAATPTPATPLRACRASTPSGRRPAT